VVTQASHQAQTSNLIRGPRRMGTFFVLMARNLRHLPGSDNGLRGNHTTEDDMERIAGPKAGTVPG
jgi:hypothetical protein